MRLSELGRNNRFQPLEDPESGVPLCSRNCEHYSEYQATMTSLETSCCGVDHDAWAPTVVITGITPCLMWALKQAEITRVIPKEGT